MSVIIRIVFVVLCAYAGTVAGGIQFSSPQGASELRSEINTYEKADAAH